MKFPTILSFLVIFSLIMFSGLSIFNGIRADYGLDQNDNLSDYGNINKYYNSTNSLYDDISGSAAGTGDTNFLTDLGSIWRTSTSFFGDSLSLFNELKNDVGNDLGINPVILNAITILVIIGFTALLVSIAVRWKVDN